MAVQGYPLAINKDTERHMNEVYALAQPRITLAETLLDGTLQMNGNFEGSMVILGLTDCANALICNRFLAVLHSAAR